MSAGSTGIGLDDIVRSYVGLLAMGQSDYEAITNRREDDYFRESLGIGRVPSAETLRQRCRLPVLMIDERNSSQEAARRFAAARAAGTRKRRDADVLDAVAAAVIVERWLSAGTQDRLSPPRD